MREKTRTIRLHSGEQVRHQCCPRKIPQQRDAEQRKGDGDIVDQQYDREENTNVALKSSEVCEDETKEERDDEVLEDSMRDTATDNPSDTGDKVFASFPVKELDVDPRQPVDLVEDEKV